MYELVYTSAAKRLFSPPELAEILKRARANNAVLGVSGILLYHEGSSALLDRFREGEWRRYVLA
jgi:hypothetical protein